MLHNHPIIEDVEANLHPRSSSSEFHPCSLLETTINKQHFEHEHIFYFTLNNAFQKGRMVGALLILLLDALSEKWLHLSRCSEISCFIFTRARKGSLSEIEKDIEEFSNRALRVNLDQKKRSRKSVIVWSVFSLRPSPRACVGVCKCWCIYGCSLYRGSDTGNVSIIDIIREFRSRE